MTLINPLYTSKMQDSHFAEQIVTTILQEGYFVLKDFLLPETVQTIIKEMKEKNLANQKKESLEGSMAYDIATSPEILAFFNLLYQQRAKQLKTPPMVLVAEKQWFGLSYKTKETGETHYHYDGAYVNSVTSLIAPKDAHGNPIGWLMMYVNMRIRTNRLCERLSVFLIKYFKFTRKRFSYKYLTYDPGNMYLFFGDLSFHGVESIAENERLILTINNHF